VGQWGGCSFSILCGILGLDAFAEGWVFGGCKPMGDKIAPVARPYRSMPNLPAI